MLLGADLLVDTVKAIETGNYKEIPQDSISDFRDLKHAPKIFKEDCLINWDQPMETVYNRIRGLSPYPTAFTSLQGKTLKIFKAELVKTNAILKPGGFVTDSKTYLHFACQDGFISVKDIQLEGKKRMLIDEFLRGVRL